MRGHPEPIELTGFRLPIRVRHMLRRNDGIAKELTFYDFIKISRAISYLCFPQIAISSPMMPSDCQSYIYPFS
jgi:hypothetical protein